MERLNLLPATAATLPGFSLGYGVDDLFAACDKIVSYIKEHYPVHFNSNGCKILTTLAVNKDLVIEDFRGTWACSLTVRNKEVVWHRWLIGDRRRASWKKYIGRELAHDTDEDDFVFSLVRCQEGMYYLQQEGLEEAVTLIQAWPVLKQALQQAYEITTAALDGLATFEA